MAEKDAAQANPEAVILGLQAKLEEKNQQIAILQEENKEIAGLNLKVSDLEIEIEELKIFVDKKDEIISKLKKKGYIAKTGGIPVQEH